MSNDGLLTLFNTNTQAIEWKKELPQGQYEDYHLRHMGRNLIAHSDSRVAMFNSQGHVIFEKSLEGEGPGAVEMFSVDSGIYSCFVRGDLVTVYKQYLQVGSFRIEDVAELPAEFTGVFEPLELMFSGESKLLLTAKVGTTGDDNQNMISVFDIDYV